MNNNDTTMNTSIDETVQSNNSESKKASFTNVLRKASDIGKKVGESTQKGAKAFLEKTKNDSYLRKMKKYNPLFPDVYLSETFNLPNIIMIVDDAIRKDIDVCEGAIGWTSNNGNMEVLHLYDNAVDLKQITFVPSISCDAIYFVDSFDHNRYINIDCIFDKAHEERLSELEHIAYSLGAKSCSIEIAESQAEVEVEQKKFHTKVNTTTPILKSEENFEQYSSRGNSNRRSGRAKTQFAGSNAPVRPTLKWFAHDDNIKKLIEMRCSDANAIKSRTLELQGSSSSTMSQKTALAIDETIFKIGIKTNSTMEKQVKKENHSKLIFEIEF